MSQLIQEAASAHRLPAPRIARMIRETAGVSQVRLATELGVHRMTVARWESGVRKPRGPLLVRYVGLLDELRRVTAA